MSGNETRTARPARWANRIGLRRWRRDKRGTTALEFAIVAPVFFAFILASFEVALAYFATGTIENATADAARLIRTGQAQSQSFNKESFKQKVCEETIAFIINCTTKLRVDARTFSTFADIEAPTCLDSDGNLGGETNFDFDPGAGESIVLITVCYELDIFVGLPNFGLANTTNGNFLIRASASFRNEPFS